MVSKAKEKCGIQETKKSQNMPSLAVYCLLTFFLAVFEAKHATYIQGRPGAPVSSYELSICIILILVFTTCAISSASKYFILMLYLQSCEYILQV